MTRRNEQVASPICLPRWEMSKWLSNPSIQPVSQDGRTVVSPRLRHRWKWTPLSSEVGEIDLDINFRFIKVDQVDQSWLKLMCSSVTLMGQRAHSLREGCPRPTLPLQWSTGTDCLTGEKILRCNDQLQNRLSYNEKRLFCYSRDQLKRMLHQRGNILFDISRPIEMTNPKTFDRRTAKANDLL